MNDVDIFFTHKQLPVFIEQSEILKDYLKNLSVEEIMKVMKCNEKIARLNYDRYQKMNLTTNLSPAIFTYEGLAFQHLAANVMSQEEFDYLEKHLYILSGFYGVLRPFDGICCYRLEMQTKLSINESKSLYTFWGSKIADEIFKDNELIINLASNEYVNCITPYLNDSRKMITCIFAHNINGKLKIKGTEAKMCRGAMVSYMAKNKIKNVDDLKKFTYMNYCFDSTYSNNFEYVFIFQT